MEPKLYLIKFTYDYYCQGYESTTEYVLVYASDFKRACWKIEDNYKNARQFENQTIL